MKKITIILQNLLILSLLAICFISISNFIIKLNKQEVDKTYMWNINYNNLEITDGSKDADLILNQNELGVNITLENELEFYEFKVDIENNGTFDASIKDIKIETEGNTDILKYYVTYEDDSEIKVSDIIKNNSYKTIKVKIEYPEQETKIYDKLTLKLNIFISFESI